MASLEHWARELAPSSVVTHRWSGQVIHTTDGLPFIGEVSDRQWVATGFAGNGMTFGTLSAMIIRDAIVGDRINPWRELFDIHRSAVARGPLDYVRENADYPYYLMRDRLLRKTVDLNALGPGDGGLVRVDGRVVAASRDAAGPVTLLAPECTHLGCLVQWNVADSTWDCPCHGSRFDREGAVLAGPATAPLARYAPGEPVVEKVSVPAARAPREANRDDIRRG
jgi:Rieske Fe-S protein